MNHAEKHLVVHSTSEFAKGVAQALVKGAPLGGVLGAGATAAVGGPAVVAAAVAAAPLIATAAVVGALGYGLFRVFND